MSSGPSGTLNSVLNSQLISQSNQFKQYPGIPDVYAPDIGAQLGLNYYITRM